MASKSWTLLDVEGDVAAQELNISAADMPGTPPRAVGESRGGRDRAPRRSGRVAALPQQAATDHHHSYAVQRAGLANPRRSDEPLHAACRAAALVSHQHRPAAARARGQGDG